MASVKCFGLWSARRCRSILPANPYQTVPWLGLGETPGFQLLAVGDPGWFLIIAWTIWRIVGCSLGISGDFWRFFRGVEWFLDYCWGFMFFSCWFAGFFSFGCFFLGFGDGFFAYRNVFILDDPAKNRSSSKLGIEDVGNSRKIGPGFWRHPHRPRSWNSFSSGSVRYARTPGAPGFCETQGFCKAQVTPKLDRRGKWGRAVSYITRFICLVRIQSNSEALSTRFGMIWDTGRFPIWML